MAAKHILVIEDDPDIVDLLRYNLEREGYAVQSFVSGEEGLKEARTHPPDLVLLDLMLPGIDGQEVCRRLKEDDATGEIPVVMLTARTEDADIVSGLELGASDYITKPFSPRVLLARVRAALRKSNRMESGEATLKVHNLTIDPGRHTVETERGRIELTNSEFKLLKLLASRPGWVFSRDQIVSAIRGDDVFVTDRTVDVHVAAVRKKLGTEGKYIETIRGVGYRFKE